ncbi:MAG: hypothetical protein EXR79_11585 [Myxococcales bacterium]|nr:hypothetical protein [Myxococcales bacterium]
MSNRSLSPVAPLVAAALLFGAATPALAATVPLSGVLRASAGGPVADGAYVVLLKLYDTKDGALFVWDDAVTNVDVHSGFFHIALGASVGKPLPDSLLTTGKPLWLGVQVGSDPELPRHQLQDVPRAYFAQAAASLECSGCVGTQQLGSGAVTAAKVGFTYAGSASKGGNALEADHALAADTAKQADSAKEATNAKFANAAKQADSAASAEELKCTGCVGLKHLDSSVANGFVSTAGGKVKGELAVDGKLALGNSTIAGGKIEVLDLEAVACDGNGLGRVAVGQAKKRLYFCDGTVWQRMAICSEKCPPASTVACGQPIADDCGDGNCKGATGSACSNGASCVDGKCAGPGESKEVAGKTCQSLLQANPTLKTAAYWLDPDGAGGGEPFQVVCDMTLEGGGWAMVGKFNANNTGATIGGINWRTDGDINLGYLIATDDDNVFNVGHLSRDRIVALTNAGEKKHMNYVKQHSTQKYKYCWNHYAAGPDADWSFVSGSSGNPGKGSCGKLGWAYGKTCGATSTSCASYDANYTMDGHWMHANGLNTGTLPGIVPTYCGDNSTSGIGGGSAATGDRRGTCYLYVR